MAKKENLSSSKTQMDDNFDNFDDFDFDAPPVKDDRSPVTKFFSGSLAGAKSTVSSEAFIRSSIKATLPDGYGLALDMQDEVSKKSKELYNNAVKEVKPIAASLSSAADKLLPAGATRLKGKLAEINKWATESEKRYSSQSKEDSEKASIAASINETFKFQMEQEAKETIHAESRQRLQEGLALTRHRDSFGLLNKINFGISRLAQYQDKVTAAYQKKSLELQYRSLFTSIDILQENKRQNAITSSAMASIVKNTALPDFVKLSEGDRLEGVLRNKFAKAIGNSLLGGKDNPIQMFSENITKVFNEKLSNMTGTLGQIADGLVMAADAKESLEGQDKAVEGGKIAGQYATGYIKDKLAPRIQKILPKVVKDNEAKIIGSIKNINQTATAFKKGSYGERDGDVKAVFFRFLKDFIPNGGVDTAVEKDNIKDLTKPAIYTKQTNKSINEVIPGYLSRIFRELQIIRTGDTKIGLTVYDPQSNKFADRKTADKNLFDFIVKKDDVEHTKKQMDGILDLVDKDQKLSPEARKAFADKTLRDNILKNASGTSDRTAHEYTYLSDDTTKEFATEIEKVMQNYFGSDSNGKINTKESYQKQNEFTDRQRNLGSSIRDARGQIQNLIDLGQYEDLERLGLLQYNKEGRAEINIEKLIQYYTGAEYTVNEEKNSNIKNIKLKSNNQKINKKSIRQKSKQLLLEHTSLNQQTSQSQQNSNNSDLINAIKDSSVKSEMKQSLELLTNIQNTLIKINEDQQKSSSVENGLSNIENIYNKTKQNIPSLTNKARNKKNSIVKNVSNSASKLKRNAPSIKNKISDKVNKIREIFTNEETIPRIKEELLKAGKYFDKTGKVIKNIFDIKDTVYDEHGNVVITKEELLKSYIKEKLDTGGEKVTKIKGIVLGFLSDSSKFIPSSLKQSIAQASKNVTLSINNKTSSDVNETDDVYLEGQQDPIILKKVMDAGGYFSKASGKVIKKISDIKGTVVDSKGNIVLLSEELKNGIKNKYGKYFNKYIKPSFDKTSNITESSLKNIQNIFGKTLDYGKKTVNGTVDNIETLQAKIKSKIDERENTEPKVKNNKTIDILNTIQEILLESNVAQGAYFTNLIENVRAIGSVTVKNSNKLFGSKDKDGGDKGVFQGASISLKNFLGKTTKSIGKLFSYAYKANKGVVSSVFNVGGFAAGKAFNISKSLVGSLTDVREIFVGDETTPRITSKLLDQGKYFDKDSKVIKNFDDIKDTVYDEKGEVIITKEELRTSKTRTRLKSGLIKIGKFAGNILSTVAGTNIAMFKMALSTGKFIVNKFKENITNQPQDIYLKGIEDPVMLKRTMQAGGYFLKSDMSVVKKPSQITGTIIDADGEVVLSKEDLRKGIYNKYGKPIGSLLGLLSTRIGQAFNIGKKIVGYGLKAATAVTKTTAKIAKKGLQAGLGIVRGGAKLLTQGISGFIGPDTNSQNGLVDNTQTLDVLERIFDVLNTRLPAKPNRKGSWKDPREKSGRNNRATDSVNAASKGSLGDGLLSKGKDLLSAGKSVLDTFSDTDPKKPNTPDSKKPGAPQPKKGLWGKTKSLGGRLLGGKTGALLGAGAMLGGSALAANSEPGSLGSAVGTGLDIAGTASTVYNIAKFVLPAAEVAGVGATTGGVVAAGSGLTAAATAGTAAATTAAAGTGIGATVLSGLGALATGIGAIVSSPVVLGMLAIAAAGTAAYFTYEYFKQKEYLKNLRYAQYGFTEKNSAGFNKSYFLEEALKNALYFKEGVAGIDAKKFDQKQALALYDINPDDTKAVKNWLNWFQDRFKPVYLTHVTALRSIDNKVKIKDVDDLKPEQKDKLLELVKFSEGPYYIDTNPVVGSSYKLTTSKEVDQAYNEARKGIDSEMKDSKNKKDSGNTSGAGQTDSTGKSASSGVSSNASIAGDASKTGKVTDKDYSKDNTSLAGTKGVVLAISGIAGDLPSASTIDTLEGIRFRSYGLTTMESDKVTALRKLENLIITKVQYGGDGKAIYKADSVDTLVAGGMFFGVTTGSELADNWNKWFQTRFLPIYLSYLGLVKQNTGAALKANATPSLTALQALSIATQISSLDSVWNVKDSPWSLYKLGTDQAIVKELIESLRQQSKQAVMPEAVVTKQNTPSNTSVGNSNNTNESIKKAIDNKNDTTKKDPVGPADAENVEMNRAPVGSPESLNGVSGLALAGGPLSDGRNASAYLRIAQGATLNGLNPEFIKNFNGLVNEYGVLTGESTILNSGFRSTEKQAALYKADPTKAAPPGTSLHEFGLAVDVQSKILDDMDKRGLLRKYGFTRPVGGEPWHLEATGIQNDIAGFKNNPDLAAKAIAAGVGKGGGGYGTMANATKYKRNGIVAKQILDAAVAPITDKPVAPVIPDKAQIAGTVQTKAVNTISTPTYDAMGNVTGSVDSEAPVTSIPAETKSKTKSEIAGSSSMRGGTTAGTASNTGNMMPALKNATVSTGAKYESIPTSSGTGWSSNKDMIVAASNAVGIDPKYMAAIGAIESGFNPSAQARTSSASGLNQFINDTWKDQMRKNATKYGIPTNASQLDPKANAILGAEYVKQNISALSGIKPDITGTDVYMAHFLGASDAKKFFSADPNSVGAQLLPKAAGSNMDIFYNGNKPRTVGEIYSLLNTRMQDKLQRFGVDSSYIPSTSGLVAKNTSTTGLEQRQPSIGLNTSTTPPGAPVVTASATPTIDKATLPVDSTSTSNYSVIPMTDRSKPMVSPMADIGGFNMQSVQQPLQNTKQDMTSAVGGISTTLTKSLDVQTRMLQALESIVKMNGTVSPNQQPQQANQSKIQTSDQGPTKSEAQQQQENAIKSFSQTANKLNVPVPMNRV